MPLDISSIEEVGFCEHINTEYQPEEKDTNTPESLSCTDCGEELESPEPDWDLEIRDNPYGDGYKWKDTRRDK